MISYLISLVVMGLIVGAIARLIVPGPQPIGILGTILAGIAGAFIAGIVGRLLFGPAYTPGLILSVLGAALIVWAVGRRGMGYGRRTYVADPPDTAYVDDRDAYVGSRRPGLFGSRRSGFFGSRGSAFFGSRGSGFFGRRRSYYDY